MTDKLIELIDNKSVSAEVSDCEKVLGDLTRVYRVADIFENNADLLALIGANELLEYAKLESFNAEEYAAFRKGVSAIGMFMAKCAEERIRREV